VSAAETLEAAREQRRRVEETLETPSELEEGADGRQMVEGEGGKMVELLSPLERGNVRAVVRGLVKTYPNGKPAIRGLSIAMCENQITCLLGHNGAGKSTFCSVLTGLFEPTAGTCSIYGNDLSTDLADIRQITGICPQQNVIFPALTVEEHLLFFASVKGFHGEALEAAVTSIIQEVGLTEKRLVASGSLSGGMKRKLCLAMALVGKHCDNCM
jgi:ATP-binding cassette, subfamily A (ABC1), member 3